MTTNFMKSTQWLYELGTWKTHPAHFRVTFLHGNTFVLRKRDVIPQSIRSVLVVALWPKPTRYGLKPEFKYYMQIKKKDLRKQKNVSDVNQISF